MLNASAAGRSGSAMLSILFWAIIAALTIVISLLVVLTAALTGWADRTRRLAHRMCALWGQAIFACIPSWRVTIIGRDRLPSSGPVIFVSNHQSAFDIMALFCLNLPFKWVAKDTLFGVPFLGWAMSSARYIKLLRGQHGSIRDAYGQAREWLQRGVSVFFFPEGTRSANGQLGAFKNGAFKLSMDTGVPLVPVAVTGTHALLQRNSWVLAPRADIRLTLLPPLHPASYEAGEVERFREDARGLIHDVVTQTAAPR